MRRRRLLASLPLVTGLAGCGGRFAATPDGTARATADQTSRDPETPSAESQWLSVKNTRATPTYLTLVVEGGDSFVQSVELLSGEERRFQGVSTGSRPHDIVLETADGERATYRWRPDQRLDGLASYLTTDGVEFWRHARCRPDAPPCALAEAVDSAALPLVGDGTARWYAPAGIVLQNHTSARRLVNLDVSLADERVLDARYRVPTETQLAVPTTYRSGTYDVTVEVDGRRVENAWPVPQVPERHVLLGGSDDSDASDGSREAITFGCGPATTTLTVENRDRVGHTIRVRVNRDGRELFRRRLTVPPRASQTLTPVDESGPYELVVESGDTETTATWWACPPHGPVLVSVDVTGTVSVRQGGPRPG